jgi:hypothetical protein
MYKHGIDISELTPLISATKGTSDWSLCIGAGLSGPLFPLWDKLIEKLYSKMIDTDLKQIKEIDGNA